MKRSLEGNDDDDKPEQKRPALASVIVEAMKLDNLQKLCSSLEPILRRIVSEEVERALSKLPPAILIGSSVSSPKCISGSDNRNLQLHFKSKLSLPLFTGGRVEGEKGATIHIVLIDANNGRPVTFGQESSLKLEVVALEGDFNNEDWSQEEFESHVVKERQGKRPLLSGDLNVVLSEGVGSLGDIAFTDNSSWTRSRKFRLGVRVVSRACDGLRVREGKTEAFTVKDHRGELYKKHYPPGLSDEVWRLEKIGKDGAFHKRLTASGIVTVEGFLRTLVRDSTKLRAILGSGMSNKIWDVLVEHAKTCVFNGKLYIYYAEESRNVGVVFNNIYELTGLVSGDQYFSADSLSGSQKVYVDGLVKKAYENWNQVTEYEGKSLLDFTQPEKYVISQTDPAASLANYSTTALTENVMQATVLPPLVPFTPPQLSTDEYLNFSSSNDQANLKRLEDWSNQRDKGFGSEEEIQIRSHEILEDEEMQQLLQLFSNEEDGFGLPSFMQNVPMVQGYEKEDRVRSGRAVVGWLKIKAAMRWGISVRRIAAERRRAQIVELENDD